MTAGRFAGQKAIVAKNYEDGTKVLYTLIKKHRFPHLLIVGIARNPRTVKRSINKKKFIKRTGVKSFVKVVNQNHVIPTRFVVNDIDLKDVKEENIKSAEARINLRKQLKTQLSNTYRNLPDPKTNEKAPHVRFFFSKLRF